MNTDDARALLARLLHRIAPEADLSAVADDEPFAEVLELDSMDFLALVTALHEETGVDVPERDYPSIVTITGIATYLTEASGAAP